MHIVSHACLLRAIVICILTSGVANAQSRQGPSLDLTVGAGGVFRGIYRSGLGGALDATFSAPMGQSLRWGASWSGQVGLQNGDDCLVRLSNPELGCLKVLPLIVSWTGLIGREWRLGSGLAARTYVGPSLIRVYRRDRSPYYWTSMGGLTGRIDINALRSSHIDVIASSRAAFIPALPRRARGTFAFGLGVRVH